MSADNPQVYHVARCRRIVQDQHIIGKMEFHAAVVQSSRIVQHMRPVGVRDPAVGHQLIGDQLRIRPVDRLLAVGFVGGTTEDESDGEPERRCTDLKTTFAPFKTGLVGHLADPNGTSHDPATASERSRRAS